MGLFNTIKKQKNINKKAEWKQGLIQTVVELNEEYMQLITATVTDTIFYKDIMNVEVVVNVVNIKTNVKTFSLMSKGIRGGSDRAEALGVEILRKMSEYK
jgi:hypothetical protein